MNPNEYKELTRDAQVAIWPQLSDAERRAITVALSNDRSVDGDIFEYRILSQRDQLFSGRFDATSITEVLNLLAREGWRVISVTAAGVNTLLGGNRDEIMIFLERKRFRK